MPGRLEHGVLGYLGSSTGSRRNGDPRQPAAADLSDLAKVVIDHPGMCIQPGNRLGGVHGTAATDTDDRLDLLLPCHIEACLYDVQGRFARNSIVQNELDLGVPQ